MKGEIKKRILIVDNNERVLWTLQSLLEDAGLNTHTTWSGREALALLAAGEFEVLLVDDYLPDLHAAEFLQRVARLPVQPWIVVMKCRPAKPGDLRRYEAFGVSAVVDKREPSAIREAVLAQLVAEPLAKPLAR